MTDEQIKQQLEYADSFPTQEFSIPIIPDQIGQVLEMWPTECRLDWQRYYEWTPKRLPNVRLMMCVSGHVDDDWNILVPWYKLEQFYRDFQQLAPLCGSLAVKIGDGKIEELKA